MTPKFFKGQLDVHRDVQQRLYGSTKNKDVKISNSTHYGYIDQIDGW